MSKPFTTVSAPVRKELFALRLMILIGVASTVYLLYNIIGRAQIGFAPFYWILMPTIAFSCLRLFHEWYHYFSISVTEPPKESKHFTVDIFTTFCAGEPYEMIVETLEAIQRIHYPHTTYLCDEANDPYLKEVCQRLNVRHITRNDHKDAKAGNINNALQYATGDLCVILDPDHVPQPEFLDPIIPHFANPAIGFVQIVQAYSNLGETLVAKGAAQQTFQFYGPIMMTMNSYGTVLAIGANCTFRRSALDSIGGHAAGLAEDMHTAMQLHAKGWKSVYVPAVLARGLVPSTLGAYYAQQLKWSRGTFELFVTTFFRLFRKFSWRQKVHYATIPLYYLSGFAVLINFLIPILSLCTGLIPFRVDMVEFLLLGMPMISSTILIRLSVQKWVMEEKERGFHVVGGLLQIGTWWIYIIGFIYTIIRKKVPYIPTPKDDKSPISWTLNIPNLLVILISASAIVYGLSYDWNPYSVVMAGIAGVNCAILTTVILISHRSASGRLRDRYPLVRRGLEFPLFLKRQFWLLRHSIIYTGLRKVALMLLLLTVIAALYLMKIDARPPAVRHQLTAGTPFYTGIFEPGETSGLVSMGAVNKYGNAHFNIISLYIPWGDAPQCQLPDSLLDAIYDKGAVPMITWEPWTSLFTLANTDPSLKSEQKVFANITAGNFDHYLDSFSAQVRRLNKPVFLRFAHEPDNPGYPWSSTGGNTPQEYISAWRYVYDFFLRNGVNNVIWVWNPWKAEAVTRYFPGKAYVDWLSVTGLDYGPLLEKRSYSFAALYQPFRQQAIFQSGLPVMIGEMGTLADPTTQTQWFAEAFNGIQHRFPEIKAAVFFNSGNDVNIPSGTTSASLNWQWKQPDSIRQLLKKYPRIDSSAMHRKWENIAGALTPQRNGAPAIFPAGIHGTNYHTGENWFRNFHELIRWKVADDFKQMRALGITTIRRYGPGIYDHNILAVAKETGMKIIYSFWIPSLKHDGKDSAMLQSEAKRIIDRITQLKANGNVIAWSIGNTNQIAAEERTDKVLAIYRKEQIIEWLNQLSGQIKAIDPVRPLSIDVDLDEHIEAGIASLQRRLPNVDAFGLVISGDTAGISAIRDLRHAVYISAVSADKMKLFENRKSLSVFLREWQDQQTRDYVTFSGVIDQWGRRKPDFYQLQQQWTGTNAERPLPEVRILRPAKTVFPGNTLQYSVLVSYGSGWLFPEKRNSDLRFEWRLIKTDEQGNAIYMTSIGTGLSIQLKVPDDPEHYRIYVQAVSGMDVKGTQSVLNLPLESVGKE